MSSGTFIKLGVEFTDKTIQKLYRDTVITAGTKFCFDSIDDYSWSKQASPLAGSDTWKNLLDGGPSAIFSGTIGFAKNAFALSTGANDIIKLPASGIAAANANAFVIALWILPDTPTASSAILSASSDYGTGNQYAITFGAITGGYQIRIYADGLQTNLVDLPDPTIPMQIGISYVKRPMDGKYDINLYKNGTLFKTYVSQGTTIKQPANLTNTEIGDGPAFASIGWAGHIYRAWCDDCSVKAPSDLIALDYAENATRIATAAAGA